MKRQHKIMNHQIDQLKEEISSKEAALVKEHLEHHRVEKEKEALKGRPVINIHAFIIRISHERCHAI